MPKGITPLQQKFIIAYIAEPNATKACRTAGYKGTNTAMSVQGCRNLVIPSIKQAIDKVLQPKRTEKLWIASAEEITAEITRMAMSNIEHPEKDKDGEDVPGEFMKVPYFAKLKAMDLLTKIGGMVKPPERDIDASVTININVDGRVQTINHGDAK